MLKTMGVGLAVTFFLFVNVGFAEDAERDRKAVSAATQWLKVVDDGKYAQSWAGAAQYFKTAMQKDQWQKTMQGVRKPLGKLVSRKLKSKSFVTSLPGAPDGKYLVIQFQTSFKNKKSAIETVTPMLDKDGKWRVAGYFIN